MFKTVYVFHEGEWYRFAPDDWRKFCHRAETGHIDYDAAARQGMTEKIKRPKTVAGTNWFYATEEDERVVDARMWKSETYGLERYFVELEYWRAGQKSLPLLTTRRKRSTH